MSSRSGGGLQGLLYAAEKHEVSGSPGATSPLHDHAVRQGESLTSPGASGSNTTLPSRKRPRARVDSEGTESTPETGRDDSDNSNSNSAASPKLCQYDTCSKPARSGGRQFCRRHGEGRRCKTPGCSKVDVGGGSCRKHGGGRRCVAEGCVKTDVGGGFCVSHGGGRRCQSEGCAKGAQAGGVFCKSHGGGRRCRIEGCMTSAQSGADVLCIKHGGGKRCMVPGCQKLVRKNNRCTKHASEGSGNADTPRATSVSVSASTAAKTAKAKAAVAATSAALAEATTRTSPAAAPPVPRRRAESSSRIEPVDHSSSPTVQAPRAPPERRETSASTGWPSHHEAFRGSSTQQSKSPALLPQPVAEGDNGRGDYAGGGPSAVMSSIACPPPSSYFAPHADFSFRGGSLSAFNPPLAAFGSRVAPAVPAPVAEPLSQDGTARGTFGGVRDDAMSSSSGCSPPPPSAGDQVPRYRGRLPGIDSLRSLSLDKQNAPSEASPLARSMDPIQSPNYSAAAHLLSLGGSMPRDRDVPPGNIAPTAGIGRTDGLSDSLALPGRGSGGSSPAQRPRAPCPSPLYRGTHFSKGTLERSPSLSPLPPSPLLQPTPAPAPAPFPTPHVPLPTVGDPQSANGGSRRVSSDPPGASSRAERGSIPVISPARPSAAVASDRAAAATYSSLSAPPSSSVSPASGASGAASGAASDGRNGPGAEKDPRTSVKSPSQGGDCRVSSEAAVAVEATARSPEEVPPTPATRPTQKGPSCCGGKQSAAVHYTGTPPANGNSSSSARSCSTSPPLEQTSSFISLSVSGMRCMENCGQTVQRALQAVPGVVSVTIHFPTRTASVNVDPGANVSLGDLTSALDAIGFVSTFVASTTTKEPALGQDGVNAVWAIANALGLVDPGCAMAWGAPCSCGDDCQCVNCPQHMKKVSHAVDLVLQAVDLSSAADPDSPPEKPQQPQEQPHQEEQDLAA